MGNISMSSNKRKRNKKQSEENIFIDRGIDRKIKNDSTRALSLSDLTQLLSVFNNSALLEIY